MKTYLKKISGLIVLIGGFYGVLNFNVFDAMSWELLIAALLSVFLVSLGAASIVCKDKILLHSFRIFVGLVFVYSGFVKAVDPLGSNYKFIDYFNAWEIKGLDSSALFLSITQSAIEFVIGLALVFNVHLRLAVIGAVLFMIFYTPITLYLALQEQQTGKEFVHDCGCFGDALIITNWQTFAKNIVLFVPTVFLFFYSRKFNAVFVKKASTILVVVFALISFGVSIYGLMHLPIIDFRPYKIGTHIPTAMQIPEGAPQPVYSDPIFILKKDGIIKEFTMNDYPTDPAWEYVDRKIELLKPGFVPPIHDFTISNDNEGDITETVLADTNYNFLLVAYDLKNSSLSNQEEINALYEWCFNNNIKFRCLTASVDSEIESFKSKSGAKYPFYSTDPITLKTIIRANPGLVMLKAGTVIDNWHHRDIPSVEEFEIFTQIK